MTMSWLHAQGLAQNKRENSCFHCGPLCFHCGPLCFHCGPLCFHCGPLWKGPLCFHCGPLCFQCMFPLWTLMFPLWTLMFPLWTLMFQLWTLMWWYDTEGKIKLFHKSHYHSNSKVLYPRKLKVHQKTLQITQ